MFTRTVLAATAISALATAGAAEIYDATGTGLVMPVAERLAVNHLVSEYAGFDTADPDNPMASSTGPCVGTVLVDAGRVSGGGLCHFTDADGDSWIVEWRADGLSDAGLTLGDWQIVAGTGKWQEATGGGRFEAGQSPDGAYINNVTGAFVLP